MKPSLLTLALVAVASSLLTIAATEFLRGGSSERPATRPASATTGEAERTSPADTLPALRPSASDLPDPRVLELEQRVAALEAEAGSDRTPVATERADPSRDDELRELVIAWVDEEREARRRADELEQQERWTQKLEFEARFVAHELAQEHDLEDWQEERFVELFTEIQTRQRELKQEFEPGLDDPEQLQEQWSEFETWAEERKREVAAELGREVYASIYGEDG